MITRDFRRSEFRCPCCSLAEPHPALVIGLQWEIRDLVLLPVHVHSGSRCALRNRAVGGAPGSFHLPRLDMDGYTCAADIRVPSVALARLFNLAEASAAFRDGGIGIYVVTAGRSWLHVDVRGVAGLHPAARWAYVDGQSASIEGALREDERRRALVAHGG